MRHAVIHWHAIYGIDSSHRLPCGGGIKCSEPLQCVSQSQISTSHQQAHMQAAFYHTRGILRYSQITRRCRENSLQGKQQYEEFLDNGKLHVVHCFTSSYMTR